MTNSIGFIELIPLGIKSRLVKKMSMKNGIVLLRPKSQIIIYPYVIMRTLQEERQLDEMIWLTAQRYMTDASLNQLLPKLKFLPQVKKVSYLVTIALPNDYSVPLLLEKLKGLKKYAYMSNYVFNIEYFSKSGENMHSHIFVPQKIHKTKTIRDFSRWFGVEPNFIDIRQKTTELQFNNALSYVKGEKEQKKIEYVEKDLKWRQHHSLEDYYEIVD